MPTGISAGAGDYLIFYTLYLWSLSTLKLQFFLVLVIISHNYFNNTCTQAWIRNLYLKRYLRSVAQFALISVWFNSTSYYKCFQQTKQVAKEWFYLIFQNKCTCQNDALKTTLNCLIAYSIMFLPPQTLMKFLVNLDWMCHVTWLWNLSIFWTNIL